MYTHAILFFSRDRQIPPLIDCSFCLKFSTYIFSTLSTVSVPHLLPSASAQRDTCYIHHSSHHRVNSPLGQPGLHSNQVMAVISNRLPCKSARIISSDNHQQSDFLRYAQKVTKNVWWYPSRLFKVKERLKGKNMIKIHSAPTNIIKFPF